MTDTPASSTAKRPRVLLVDDYEPNVMVATIYLEYFGCDYDVAYSGLEAVKKACATVYDAILMDVKMPDINGYEATRRIREFEKENGRKPTAIIGMTAHALIGDRERCINSGMDDYIAKPISENGLRDKLELNFVRIGLVFDKR